MTTSSSLPSINTHINTQTPIFLLSNISNYVTIKLGHSNYLMWKFQITGILDAYSLLDHLEDPTSCPSKFLFSHSKTETQEVNPLYTQWRARDKALFSIISSTLSPSSISLVMGQTSASGIWKILVNRYTSVSRSNIVNLKQCCIFRSVPAGTDGKSRIGMQTGTKHPHVPPRPKFRPVSAVSAYFGRFDLFRPVYVIQPEYFFAF